MRWSGWGLLAAAAALVAAGAGCSVAPSGGMADRCARIMKEAYPGGDIAITNSEAAATSLTTILAHVEGMRHDLPAGGPVPRHLAVECRFDDSILTRFRWTAGPLQAAGK
jgi:hypothetical protein